MIHSGIFQRVLSLKWSISVICWTRTNGNYFKSTFSWERVSAERFATYFVWICYFSKYEWFQTKDNKLHFKKDDQYKMFHNKVKGFLKKRQDRYIVMVSCYITNRQMINYSCVPLKGFEKKLTKLFVKTLLKHH